MIQVSLFFVLKCLPRKVLKYQRWTQCNVVIIQYLLQFSLWSRLSNCFPIKPSGNQKMTDDIDRL